MSDQECDDTLNISPEQWLLGNRADSTDAELLLAEAQYVDSRDGYRVAAIMTGSQLNLILWLSAAGECLWSAILGVWNSDSGGGLCQRLFWIWNGICAYLNAGGETSALGLSPALSRPLSVVDETGAVRDLLPLALPEGYQIVSTGPDESGGLGSHEHVFINENQGSVLVWHEDIGVSVMSSQEYDRYVSMNREESDEDSELFDFTDSEAEEED